MISTASAEFMGYNVAVVALFTLLALKEILIPESHKNTKIARFITRINIAILALLFVFLYVFANKVVNIL
jgi:phosphoglycerol transferase MdoB-like AlkP superfamily enzyme